MQHTFPLFLVSRTFRPAFCFVDSKSTGARFYLPYALLSSLSPLEATMTQASPATHSTGVMTSHLWAKKRPLAVCIETDSIVVSLDRWKTFLAMADWISSVFGSFTTFLELENTSSRWESSELTPFRLQLGQSPAGQL